MAQYKVPQDVEADDKLIGPFSFRQFVYLMIAGGLVAAAVGLFQLFPALAVVPAPFALFFLALALPLRKDQPMETYLAAIVSFYLKPHSRVWVPGQKESPILITAPKTVDDYLTRDITSEEATHRLSFLADIVDTGGYAIKGAGANPIREDLVAEAKATPDMFETYQSQVINRVIDQDKMSRHRTAVEEMRKAIAKEDPNAVLPERSDVKDEVTTKPASGTDPILKPAEESKPKLEEQKPEEQKPEEPKPEEQVKEPVEIEPKEENKAANLRDYAVLKPDIEIDSSDVVIRPEKTMKKQVEVRVPGMGYFKAKMEDEKNEANKEPEKLPTNPVNNSIMELANNPDFTVATIAKEANRINRKEKGEEVFVSLH